MASKGYKRLTAFENYQLMEWLRENLESFRQKSPTIPQVAQQAIKDLKFQVTVSTIETWRESYKKAHNEEAWILRRTGNQGKGKLPKSADSANRKLRYLARETEKLLDWVLIIAEAIELPNREFLEGERYDQVSRQRLQDLYYGLSLNNEEDNTEDGKDHSNGTPG